MADAPYKTPCALPTPYERELLIILIEECLEVGKRATKMLRFGADEVQPGQELSNSARLGREIGDVDLMIMRVAAAGLVSRADIMEGRRHKAEQLDKYMQTKPQDVS